MSAEYRDIFGFFDPNMPVWQDNTGRSGPDHYLILDDDQIDYDSEPEEVDQSCLDDLDDQPEFDN